MLDLDTPHIYGLLFLLLALSQLRIYKDTMVNLCLNMVRRHEIETLVHKDKDHKTDGWIVSIRSLSTRSSSSVGGW